MAEAFEGLRRWVGAFDELSQPNSANPLTRVTTGGDGEGIGPVCIGVVEGPLRAEIARTYLEQAGVDVYLQGAPVASIYGIVSGPLASVRVIVPASQAEEAARIFAELDFETWDMPEDESDAP